MKNAASVAFSLRKKDDGDAMDDKPMDEMSHAASIAHAILASKKTSNGSVEDPNAAIEDDSVTMEALSNTGDDSLAPVGDPGDENRKKMLKDILSKIRSK